MKVVETVKAVFFVLLAAAFFIVPWCCKEARNYAPGLAVVAGVLFSVTVGNPLQKYTGKITSQMLGATIVGMGFGMNLLEVLRAGANGFIYTAVGIAAGIGLGVFVGKRLGLSRNSMYLVSVGTSLGVLLTDRQLQSGLLAVHVGNQVLPVTLGDLAGLLVLHFNQCTAGVGSNVDIELTAHGKILDGVLVVGIVRQVNVT